MLIKKWEKLPEELRIDEIRPYYELLRKKNFSLFVKRLLDIIFSFVMLILLLPFFLLIALIVKIDSKGPVFYRQVRVTQYGKKFRIFKFRTMYDNADKNNQLITGHNDKRITRVGKVIRNCRIDELSQLIDILRGTMTFVGTRPEVCKYVNKYTPEMKATLLLPAGVTSVSSILAKDENALLENERDIDEAYLNKILIEKMKWNLSELKRVSVHHDIHVCFMTIFAMFGKNYEGKIK